MPSFVRKALLCEFFDYQGPIQGNIPVASIFKLGYISRHLPPGIHHAPQRKRYNMKLVIIGTGIAALSAAEAFRKHDTESEVLMLGADRHPPYFRIKLSHLLAKPDVTIEEVLVKKEIGRAHV